MINKAKTVLYLLMSLTLTISIFSVIVFDVFLSTRKLEDQTTIIFNNQYIKSFKIDLTNFNPGDEKECKIDFNCLDLGVYSLKTIISDNKGKLFDYISLDILCGKRLLVDKIDLMTYLTHPYSFKINFNNSNTSQVIYRYSIADEVGNEAQNLNASFNFDLELKKVV